MSRVWELLKSHQWLMTQEALEVIANIAMGNSDLQQYEALQAERGRPLANSRRVDVRGDTGNVAVIPVTGPIFPRANLFTWMSGATSTEVLAQDLRTALDNRTIDAIVFDIDSPGGAVAGIHELGNMIYEARKQKPVIAYGMHQVASAAYWLGSAAQQMVVDRTAVVGSIGVVLHVQDTTGRDERAGVRSYTIVSSQSPDKVLNPGEEKGRAKLQKVADDMATVFLETVARNRNVDMKTVLSDYGQGGTLLGDAAVAAGMVDRIGSLEQVIEQLSAEGRAANNRRIFNMARGPIIISSTLQLREALKAGHTAEEIEVKAVDVAALEATAKLAGAAEEKARLEAVHTADLKDKTAAASADGVKTERARIAGIQGIALPGFEAEMQKAIEAGSTPEAFAMEQSKAQKDRGTSRQQQRGDAPRAIGHGGAAEATEQQQGAQASGKLWDHAATKVTPIGGRAGKR